MRLEFKQAVITKQGRELMAKLLAGKTTKFTKIAVSSTVYQDNQLETLTALTNIKQTTEAQAYSNNQATVAVVGALENTGLTAGYYINTVGLFASDPDKGEILYSVSSASVNGYMPPDTGVSKSGVELKIYTEVSNATQVDLTVDPAAYATRTDVQNVVNKVDELKIGGPNVLLNSEKMTENWANLISSSTAELDSLNNIYYRRCWGSNESSWINHITQSVKLEKSTEYTISFLARSSDPSITPTLGVRLDRVGKIISFGSVKVSGEWTRYSFTKVSNDDGRLEPLRFYAFAGTGAVNYDTAIQVSRVKLEIGNKATPWCPSFFDYTSISDFNALKDRVAALETLVSQLT